MLDFAAKRRLTGAVVLVVLAVVFLPMLLEEDDQQNPMPEEEFAIPEPPPAARGPQAEIFPSVEEPGSRSLSAPAESPDQAPGPEPVPGAARDDEDFAVGEPEPATELPMAPPAKPEAGTRKPIAETDTEKPKPAESIPAAPAKPKPVPKGVTSWVVQVAALSTPEAAEKLEKKLRAKGFPAFVEKLEGTHRTLWRVRVGPEVERSRAKALATGIKQQTGLDVYVKQYGD